MTAVVALVGRPNVGKSTLFNRLTKTRDALVADFPGLTRDRKYGQAYMDGCEYLVIDTGGIDGSESGIEEKMVAQSLVAIDEADIVLFLVDARAGLVSADMAIAQYLREHNKKTVVVVNKTDGLDAASYAGEFFALGFSELVPIAASQGRGVHQLMEKVLAPYGTVKAHQDQQEDLHDGEYSGLLTHISDENTQKEHDEIGDEQDPRAMKIAIVGRPNVGKSTLTNSILGEERVVVYDLPGTTRDSIYIPLQRNEQDYVIIDTAGVRKRGKIDLAVEKFSVIKTLKAINDANVVLLMIDAQEGIGVQDLSLLGFILNAGKSLVIVINKWDSMTHEDRQQVKNELDRRLGFIDFARVHFISALRKQGIGDLFRSINEAYASAVKRHSTARLTRILQLAVADHQPPLVAGRRIKLKYAHPGGYNPPIIVIHGNQVEQLPDGYKRYLVNYFRKSLQLIGTPLRLIMQEGDNPYAGKKNVLTPTQMRKRQRLMKFVKSKK